MTEPCPLLITGLGHQYGTTEVLSGVDLRVDSGEFVSLLGPSGCGKTTLLRAVAGLVTPSSGLIAIAGKTVTESGTVQVCAAERGVGLVFQEYALFPHMTVAQNIGYGLESQDSARISGLMELVGISGLQDRKPSELSGGQQQRVALARALAPRPALLLLDEPFANVDAGLRDALGRMLKRVVRDEGASVLMVTHDQDAALALADRVVVLDVGARGGRVIQDATPEQIYHCPATVEVAKLSGPVVLVPAEASGSTASSAIGDVGIRTDQSGSVHLVIRPEQLRFVSDTAGTVVVEEIQFHGAHHHLRCSSPAGPIDALVPGSQPMPAVGSTGRVEVTAPVWSICR